MNMIDIETMETIFSEIAYSLQNTPENIKRRMIDDAPLDYADGVERAAGLIAWLLLARLNIQGAA